jgi:hypothetical protein
MYSTTSGCIGRRGELVEAYRQEDDFAEEIRTAKGT